MLKATRPFKNEVTGYPKEPALRIGRKVPDNAVNLAYYFNPTATGSEKIMTAEAPRNTVDHRVEEQYKYLFEQVEDDDDLFPKSVLFSDEEGYTGRLGRMFVNWYPKSHVNQKTIEQVKTEILVDKDKVTKAISYQDKDGYTGTLYLDTTDWTITRTKTTYEIETQQRIVNDFEVSYADIYPFAKYIPESQLSSWEKDPRTDGTSPWPRYIEFVSNGLRGTNNGAAGSNGSSAVNNHIKSLQNSEGLEGFIEFKRFEKETLYSREAAGSSNTSPTVISTDFLIGPFQLPSPPTNNTSTNDGNSALQAEWQQWSDNCEQILANKMNETKANLFKEKYEATYNAQADIYEYSQISEFISNVYPKKETSDPTFENAYKTYLNLKDTIGNHQSSVVKGDAVIIRTYLRVEISTALQFFIRAKYNYAFTNRGQDNSKNTYNLVAVYGSSGNMTPVKRIVTTREVPAEYSVVCHYKGLARHVWMTYDGMAYYRGAVTKGNSVGAINPEDDNELLMYSDEDGFLRIPRLVSDDPEPVQQAGETSADYKTRWEAWNSSKYMRNYYTIEADYVYITDVFKDGVACFYKYILDGTVYDYRGPDSSGFYEGNAIKVVNSAFRDIPEDYKYAMKLEVIETESYDRITQDYNIEKVTVPSKYRASLYTSFISGATDTFKIVYNSTDSNGNLVPGKTEDVYNFPFMYKNVDYRVITVDENSRMNKIQLTTPRYIEDTRLWISLQWYVQAERKESDTQNARVWRSKVRTSTILNRDYALSAELDNFEGRGWIISPTMEGILMSPAEIIQFDIQGTEEQSYLKVTDTDVIYSAHIELSGADVGLDGNTDWYMNHLGAINLKCNADGSGIITAETTVDTGFYDEATGRHTRKLAIDAPYLIEGGKIFPAFKVKCVDSRYIKVTAPRETKLLESWYPKIQFGHYSQILDQYGTHKKVSYSMPEFDNQKFSPKYGSPYVDVTDEKVTILNPHMVRTLCYPIHVYHPDTTDKNTYFHVPTKKTYKVFLAPDPAAGITWADADTYCRLINGKLAEPNSDSLMEFMNSIAYDDSYGAQIETAWVGAYNDSGVWKWASNGAGVSSPVTWQASASTGEYACVLMDPIDTGEWDMKLSTETCDGFICEFEYRPTVKLYKLINGTKYEIGIENVSFKDGVIVTKDTVSENDTILCDYTYVEEYFVYRGYWKDSCDFVRLDLNPNIYHTYGDPTFTPSETKPSKNLFNKVIYFFLKPSVIYNIPGDVTDNELIGYGDPNGDKIQNWEKQIENKASCIYHQIDVAEPKNDTDIYIGSVYIRQDTSLHSTILIDSRSRGGGVLEEMPDKLRRELEPESDYYLDIGYFDGKPYQENGVIIIRLDRRLLKEFGGKFTQGDIEYKVKRWLGEGVYPIIEYVNVFAQKKMPQYTLEVEDDYLNLSTVTPAFTLSILTKNT